MGRDQIVGIVQAGLAGFLTAGIALARTLSLVGRPEQIAAVVPDDAFYYLQLGHNWATLGRWTFDGTAPTSGFQLLQGYLVGAVDLVVGANGEDFIFMFVLIGVAASLSLGVSAALLTIAAQRTLGTQAGWWPMLAMLSPAIISTATSLMESYLVVLTGAAALFVVSAAGPLSTRGRAGLMAIGFVGALSRIEFVLLPVLVWLSYWLQAADHPVRVRRAANVAIGAMAGFAATLVHSLVVSGTLLPTSVLTKMRWTVENPSSDHSLVRAILIVVILLLAGYSIWAIRQGRASWLVAEPMSLACLLAVLVYEVVVISITRGGQNWQAAVLYTPAALVIAALGSRLPRRIGPVVALCLSAAVAAASVAGFNDRPFPPQLGYLHAARALAADPSISRVGAWQAGMLAVVSGKTVTNLDGLVDDRAAEADRQGQLFDYLRERGIDYILDSPLTLSTPESGRPDPRIARCYLPDRVVAFPSDPVSSYGPITLFAYVPGCH